LNLKLQYILTISISLSIIVSSFAVLAASPNTLTIIASDIVFVTDTPMRLNFSVNTTISNKIGITDNAIIFDSTTFKVTKTLPSAINVTVQEVDGLADAIGEVIIRFNATSQVGSVVTFNVTTNGGVHHVYANGVSVFLGDINTIGVSSVVWSDWTGNQTFLWIYEYPALVQNVLIYAPWVVGFVALMTLTLMGAFWIKGKRQGR